MRRRIRQISVDDSNSMSDLAKIIEDLHSPSPCHMMADGMETSDTDLSSTLPASALRENGGFTSLNVTGDIDLSQSNHF